MMPVGDQEGYPKGHFNRVYDYIIVPACKHEGKRFLPLLNCSLTTLTSSQPDPN